jgi:hypothetical protein
MKTKRAGLSKRRTLKRKQRGGVVVSKTLADGSVVSGEMNTKKTKISGSGKRVFEDGSVYEGPFNNGFIPHGQGKFTMADGSVYEGQFSNGGVNGRGVLTEPKGVTKCTFNTVQVVTAEGVPQQFFFANGHGERTYAATGTVYRGEFTNSKLNGPGTLTMTDGSEFRGDFKNDLATGRLTHADGTVEEGIFWYDEQTGNLVPMDYMNMPSLELDLELNPGPWNPKLKTRYDVERAIAERASA